MKPLIIPAILPKTIKELEIGLKKIKPFSRWVQIDIADGKFVDNKTISLEEIINNISLRKRLNLFYQEYHLMVENPEKLLEMLQKIKPKRVFMHFEAIKNYEFLKKIVKNLNFDVGLAINPNTQIKDLEFLADYFKFYLFMTVFPGFQGQKFISNVLTKINNFKKNYPNKFIEVDGGINDQTIKLLNLNIDYIVSGSFILKAKNPKENYLKLLQLLNG